jgi:hypothetical protein
MTDERDDDALAWAGDDDPTLAPPSAGPVAEKPAPTVVPPAPTAPATKKSTRASKAAAAAAAAEATAAARPTVLDEAEAAEDRAAEKDLEAAEAETEQMSSAALVAFGVVGGVYLLYTFGWVVSFSRYQVPLMADFTVISYRITQVLAIAAPPVWFVAALLILQKRDVRYRFLWLVIGVLLLVPWPFLLGA